MKMTGILFLFLACFLAAMQKVRNLRARPQALRETANALDVVDQECRIRMTPLQEAFRRASETGEISSAFFCLLSAGLDANLNLSEAWTLAVPQLKFLTKEEQNIVLSLKDSLGRYDTDAQSHAILYCTNVLREHADAAQANLSSGVRLVLGLSMAGGLMLVILFC